MGEERVRVVVERSGGLAGRAMPPVVLDTAEVSADDAQRTRALVAEAGVEDLPAVSRSPQGRDMLRYDVTISRGDQTWRLVYDDGSVPAALRPLLYFALERGQTP